MLVFRKTMPILNEGREIAFLFVILLTVLLHYLTEYAKTHDVQLRKLASFEAMGEAVGRCAELGKPLVIHCGQRNLDHPEVAVTLSALEILSYVAKQCAEAGVRIIVPTLLHTAYPVQVERVREAYMEAGVPDDFDENDVRFLSPHHQVYATGVMSLFEREDVGANIMVGRWSGISMAVAETSSRLGIFGVGGTDQTSNMPFFIPTMDYAIIGEEMYALGAYVGKAPRDIGNIFAKDIMKLLVIGVILLGVLLAFLGIPLSNVLLL
jgi:hypothetical protein